MAALIKVDVVSAEKSIYSGTAKLVVLPGESGSLGILPGHTPLITRIRPGVVKLIHENDQEEVVFVAGGILEVQPNAVIVLADVAERVEELDREKAQQARQRAEENLRRVKSQDRAEIAVVEAELAMLAAQVKAIDTYRKLGKRS
ncbi:F0F1 ATP synthase subunit epsilon [Brackiella oedipodis]|uniref:F0F1 ATP synthase subunit epsilon n=1 Tax=Brackiella oedipodis TaxID=124225 RepID=UPI00048F512C|nr:F0F1 ATP synthase subunit epsilon [Brackiella oedipodis]